MKKDRKKYIAKKMALFLDTYLGIDANSVSCIVTYQPKAPKELARYKKTK